MRSRDNITPVEGRNPALFMQLKGGGSRDCHVANHPDAIRTLQRKLYVKAKQEPADVMHSLY